MSLLARFTIHLSRNVKEIAKQVYERNSEYNLKRDRQIQTWRRSFSDEANAESKQ